MRPHAKRYLLAVLGGLVLAGSVLGLTTPAQAHNYLVSSNPTAGSTLTVLPDTFTITTNDALLDLGGQVGGFALQIHDADQLYYGDGCVTIDGPTMSAAPALGPPGIYTIEWQVASTDGHTVSDEFTFTWAPTHTTQISEGTTTPPICGSTNAAGNTSAPTTGPREEDSGSGASDGLWWAATVIAVLTAAGITLLATRRKKRTTLPETP